MKEIKELIEITDRLRKKYKRNFTLDGNLVGDIGEVLAKQRYNLKLYNPNCKIHDAEEIKTKRKVQIKSTFKDTAYFPKKDFPDYILYLKINNEGEIDEIFNGPGDFIVKEYIIKRDLSKPSRHYYGLSTNILRELNKKVKFENKIKLK